MTKLQDILSFESPSVIGTFKKNFKVTTEEATDIFFETKKWLYLCRLARQTSTVEMTSEGMVITKELAIIDEMWHSFIINTKPYHDFCTNHLGTFIHHVPVIADDPIENKELSAPKSSENTEQRLGKLRDQLLFTQKHLGNATLKKWYVDYARYYTQEKIKSLRT